LKILHIVPSYWPAFRFGGPIFSTHLLNKTLVRKGVDVTVYTTNAGLRERKDIEPGAEVALDRVKIHYFNYIGPENYNFSPALTIALLKNLKNYDLVHISAVWNYPVLIGSFLCRLFKKPYIITPRGALYPYLIKNKSRFKKILYFNLFVRYCFERASAVHYTTEEERLGSYKNLNPKYFIIPNGIDLSEFGNLPPKGVFKKKISLPKGAKYVLFLGRINWKKGIDLLIKAFNRLSKERENLFLIIAGPEESYAQNVKELIAKLGIENKCIFLGMVKGQDKLSVFQDAEMFVLCSYSENFGMAVVEAMACGIPVIVSDKVGIFREIKEKKAGVVVKCNQESVYRGMKAVLENEKLSRELSLRGKNLVKDYYDIEVAAKHMIKAYKKILSIKQVK